jgi:hypothetical protein
MSPLRDIRPEGDRILPIDELRQLQHTTTKSQQLQSVRDEPRL